MGIIPHANGTITKRSTTVGSLGYDVSFHPWSVKGVAIHFEGSTVLSHVEGSTAITGSSDAYITSDGTTLILDGMWDPGETIITLKTPTANGSDKIVDGGFAGDGSAWTQGAGWSLSAGKAVHVTANATALVEAVSTIVNTETYLLTYTISTITAGTLTPSAGGVTLTARTTAGTFSEEFTATSTAALTFTASSTFAGSIDDVALYKVTPITVSVIAWR